MFPSSAPLIQKLFVIHVSMNTFYQPMYSWNLLNQKLQVNKYMKMTLCFQPWLMENPRHFTLDVVHQNWLKRDMPIGRHRSNLRSLKKRSNCMKDHIISTIIRSERDTRITARCVISKTSQWVNPCIFGIQNGSVSSFMVNHLCFIKFVKWSVSYLV
jgi:hypothetical protein